MPACLPVPRQHDPLPVLQAKAADIQRIGRGMLTEPALLAVIDVAAGEAAQMIDLRHRLAKHLLRCRLQAMLFEQRIGHRQRATGQEAATQPRLALFYTPDVLQRAIGRCRAIGLRPIAQAGGRQRLAAQLRIITQTRKLIGR
ncbi:hypothetical protein D3C79_891650 [compost metagenome]